MRLQQLELLLAIADTGSLRASAEALHVTQPALTKALKQLEAEFGVPLVLRTPQGARLAPAGELLAARAASALRELARAREEVDWHVRHARARVTVGLSPVAGILLAPGAVARFSARMPQVRLRMVDAVYPRAQALLRSGELDLAIGPLPPRETSRDLVAQPLFDSANVVVVRTGHPLAGARSLKALRAARWVLVGPAGGPGDPASIDWAGAGLSPPEVRIECESFTSLLALMTGTDVVGSMPRVFLERFAQPMGLIAVPVVDRLPVTTLHAVRRADAPLTLPAQRLLDDFVEEAKLVSDGR